MHCASRFPRTEFFIIYAIDILATLVVIGLSFTVGKNLDQCVTGYLLARWALFTSAVVLLLTLTILIANLFWMQRYTNSPGNIAWLFMIFVTIPWESYSAKNFFIIIGAVYAFISITTLLVHATSLCDGVTIQKRRLMKRWWIFYIVIMILL